MNRKKLLIVIICVFLFISVIAVIFALIHKVSETSNTSSDKQNAYVDKSTGLTVLTPTGKTVEPSAGTDGVLYLGLSQLVNIGISNDQLITVQGYFSTYAAQYKAGNDAIEKIALVTSSLKQTIDQDTGLVTISGTIMLNDDISQNVVFTYSDPIDIQMTISDSSNNPIYSSPAPSNGGE